MTDTLHSRLDELESLVKQQQKTIEKQQETIATQQEKLEGLTDETVTTAAEHSHIFADGGDIKVVGEIDADEGIGVRGKTSGDGETIGVRGDAASVTGRGVMGFATSEEYEHDPPTSLAAGVMGVTDRTENDLQINEGGGVFGWATADSGDAYGVLGRNDSVDGWGVVGTDTSNEGYGVYSVGDSLTWGNHEITGDLSFSDGTPQRTAGPVAKGYISDDATLGNAVNVEAVERDGDVYRITLTDISYWFDEYVTVVTPLGKTRWRLEWAVRVTIYWSKSVTGMRLVSPS